MVCTQNKGRLDIHGRSNRCFCTEGSYSSHPSSLPRIFERVFELYVKPFKQSPRQKTKNKKHESTARDTRSTFSTWPSSVLTYRTSPSVTTTFRNVRHARHDTQTDGIDAPESRDSLLSSVRPIRTGVVGRLVLGSRWRRQTTSKRPPEHEPQAVDTYPSFFGGRRSTLFCLGKTRARRPVGVRSLRTVDSGSARLAFVFGRRVCRWQPGFCVCPSR